MIDLLMLGIVPGTNIQIDFGDWMRGICILCVCILCITFVRYRVSIILLIAFVFLRPQKHFKVRQDLAPVPVHML